MGNLAWRFPAGAVLRGCHAWRGISLMLLALFVSFPVEARCDNACTLRIEPLGGEHTECSPTRPSPGHPTSPGPRCCGCRSRRPIAPRPTLRLAAEDMFSRAVDWKEEFDVEIPAGGKTVDRFVAGPAGPGYYSIRAEARVGGETRDAWTDLGIVPEPYPGVRPIRCSRRTPRGPRRARTSNCCKPSA